MTRRMSLQRDDVELGYLDTGGDGPIVVLLHGLAGSATELLPTASALHPDFRSILLAQRGHCHSTRLPQDTSRDAFVADVVAVVENVGGPVRLVGQSVGAHTALLVAASRPDLVERLVLLEGHADGAESDESTSIGAFFSSWPVPFESRDAATRLLGGGALARAWADDLDERSDGFWPRFDPDVMESTIRAVHEPRWLEWASIEVPVLAVFAENGMFSEEQRSSLIARRPATARVDLVGAGHDAHLDAFEPWVQALRGFL